MSLRWSPGWRSEILRAPKVLLHDHLDGGLRPATVVELAAESGYQLPDDGRRRARRLVPGRRRLRLAGALPGDVRAHRRRSCRPRRRCTGSPPSAPRTWPPTGWSTPRCGSRPELHLERGADPRRRSSRRCWPGSPRGRRGRPRPGAGSGSARCSPRCGTPPARWRSPSWRCGSATSGVVGFDIAGAEAGLPADPAPGRVRIPAAGERPLHHPRRRGVRAAVDLAGDPVVRRRPARPRGADHRRHHRRGRTATARSAGWRRTSGTSGSRWSSARRPTCRPARRRRSPSTRSGCWPGCGSGSRSTPTTG